MQKFCCKYLCNCIGMYWNITWCKYILTVLASLAGYISQNNTRYTVQRIWQSTGMLATWSTLKVCLFYAKPCVLVLSLKEEQESLLCNWAQNQLNTCDIAKVLADSIQISIHNPTILDLSADAILWLQSLVRQVQGSWIMLAKKTMEPNISK